MSWRDEARQDKLVSAQIDRDRDAARAQAGIAAARAAAAERREDQAARDGRREDARRRRAKQRDELAAWAAGHVTDLLFLPVIVVPAILAWTAMAAYGHDLYGPLGRLLPAFSEGGMWVFAFARTITLRSHPGRPTWHLLAGTWVFAAVGAGLNFLHGLTAPGNQAHAGIGTGAVMALVSAAGVTAHQLVTAGPRRSRAERQQRRLDRRAGARVLAVRRAAIRHAAALVDRDGDASLVIAPGLVAVDRRGRLARIDLPELPDPTSELARLAGEAAAEIGALAASLREPLPVLDVSRPARLTAAGLGEPGMPGVARAGPPVPEPDDDGPQGGPLPEPEGAAHPEPGDALHGGGRDSRTSRPRPPRPARPARPARPRQPARAAVDMSAEAQEARRVYRASVRSGKPMSDRKLAEQFGISRRQAGNLIAQCQSGPHLAARAQ